jgi:hypothetical protein
VAKGGEKGLGWVAEDKFCGESADGDVSAARRIAVRRVVLEGEPRERETYVAKAASLRLEIGGVVGLMERAEISGARLGGWGGG